MTTQTSASRSGPVIMFGKAPWWVLAVEGAALILLGLVALIAPFVASLAVTLVIGWIYLFAGGVRVVSSLTHRGPGFGWSLLIGCLALIAGAFLLARPLAGLFTLTFVLGVFFLAGAVMSFVLAATVGRKTGRTMWLIANGFADLVLGVVVFAGLVAGAVWFLGLLVAVNLIFAGTSLLVIGTTVRGPKAA